MKTKIPFLIFISILLLSGWVKNTPELKDNYKISLKEISGCTNDLKTYYQEEQDKIYLLCKKIFASKYWK